MIFYILISFVLWVSWIILKAFIGSEEEEEVQGFPPIVDDYYNK